MADDEPMASGDEAPDPNVETLIAGRQKRATAGNRMHALLDKEEDDDLQLLFAENEEEEDVEFAGEDADAASDVELGSSSDDDDQGPAAGTDDLEGEHELQRQAKAERKKKRKDQEFVKRPVRRIARKLKGETAAPSAPTIPAPKLDKKKSERVSWLPTADEGAVRQSTRKQTMQNKQYIHQRLKESEKRRRHQLQVMEAAAKRKDATQPKALSQADRMAEAARVERHNAKSLNHWEEEERRRAEERRAKLAALKNRKLDGPYVTWWSGPSVWVDDNLVVTGRRKNVEDIVKVTVEGIKAKATIQAYQQMAGSIEEPYPPDTNEMDETTRQSTAAATDPKSAIGENAPDQKDTAHDSKAISESDVEQDIKRPTDAKDTVTAIDEGAKITDQEQCEAMEIDLGEPPRELPAEIKAPAKDVGSPKNEVPRGNTQILESKEAKQPEAPPPASKPTSREASMTIAVPETQANHTAVNASDQAPKAATQESISSEAGQRHDPEAVFHVTENNFEHVGGPTPKDSATNSSSISDKAHPVEQISIPEPIISKSARTLVILENVQPSTFPGHVLTQMAPANPTHRVKRIYKTAKYRADPAAHAAAVRAAAQAAAGDRQIEAPPPEKCAITGLPAHFRDPATGLPYHDIHAYRAMRNLKDDSSRWSNLLGCYTGPIDRAARGAPEKVTGSH
jgi:vacuolar protein sorting-associated protein 72